MNETTLHEWIKSRQIELDRLLVEQPHLYLETRKRFTDEFEALRQEQPDE